MCLTLAAGTCLAGVASCSEQPALGPAVAAASAHFAAFERFERWAARSVSSDVGLRGQPALRETLFAPLRSDRTVLWADVYWEPAQVLQYRTPIADSELSFMPVEAPSLGRVLVAVCESCKKESHSSECIVIERPAKQRPARVRIAFCKREPEPQASTPKRKVPQARAKSSPEARAQVAK